MGGISVSTRRRPPAGAPALAILAALALAAGAAHAGARDVRPLRARGPAAVTQWQDDWAQGAVFYEIFVRSFADASGDGKGDLKGLIARLDYLNDGDPATTTDLGVDALWLMPVFLSPSYHGYDTTDYEHINPDYGSDEDFATLCQEAHRRGIRIILDLVINHTSSAHPWFVDSASSPSSVHRDWYVWNPSCPGWTQPWGGTYPTWYALNGSCYYAVFWSGMPDLNFRTAAVRAEVKRLAGLWLARGADGFRLDASRYLIESGSGRAQADTPETHAFWKELAAFIRAVKPQATLVAENWTDTPIIATYYGSSAVVAGGDELPMSFDFPLADAIVRGVNAGNAGGIAAKLAEVARVYPAGAADAPFLTNHDQVRLATQLGLDQGKLRSAAAILLTVPGAPFIYYGEEIGIENGTTQGDESKRTPMPWDRSSGGGFTTGTPWFPFAPDKESANVASESGDPASLLALYRSLIRARHGSEALRAGAFELLSPAGGSTPVLAFLRSSSGDRVVVAHNLGTFPAFAGPYALGASSAEAIFIDRGAAASPAGPGSWSFALPPRATGIWRLHA